VGEVGASAPQVVGGVVRALFVALILSEQIAIKEKTTHGYVSAGRAKVSNAQDR
jgi:hypothetical protein